ncbi:MAG: hypothetical protein ABL996_08545 [Micropepsaceae bacterium]
MTDLNWTQSEKKIARRAFDQAANALLTQTIDEFKAKAAAIVEPQDLWALEDHLRERRREIESLLDYRYSQLTHVFGRLIAQGHLTEQQLEGLSEDKLALIRRTLAWCKAA